MCAVANARSLSIKTSVGDWSRGAKNNPDDVRLIQTLLIEISKKLNNPMCRPGGVNGEISKPSTKSSTVRAIRAYQRRFLSNPDGRVDPGGTTWRNILRDLGLIQGPFFPFAKRPSYPWTTGARRFASNRSGGKRAHAGCDLYQPAGTPIYAVQDGAILKPPYYFYCQTYALEVDHGDFVIRYGELKYGTAKRSGKVLAGEKIAEVGHLVGISVSSDMLHMEMYAKGFSGPLTQRSRKTSKLRTDGVPFYRRKDLIDPTPYLNKWKANLPG